MAKGYVPARADLVSLDWEPRKGAEPGTAGRPSVVLTDTMYNQSGRAIVMGVSTSIRGNALEVDLSELYEDGTLSQPSVLCTDLVRHMDWRRRNIQFIGRLPLEKYAEAIEKLGAIVGDEILEDSTE